MIEENFRRALILSRGDMMVFLERPVSATFIALSSLLLLWSAYSMIKERKGQGRAREGGLHGEG